MDDEKFLKIMIVDDRPQWAELFAKSGILPGMTFVITDNSKEVMRLLIEERYDLLITDVRMPNKDGYTLIRQIRKKFREMPIIVITAYDTYKIHDKIEALNISDVLIKPFSMSKLKGAIEEALKIKGNALENQPL